MLRRPLPFIALAQAAGIGLADRGVLTIDAAMVLAASAAVLLFVGRRLPTALALVLALCAGALGLGTRLDLAARHRPARPIERVFEGRIVDVRGGPGWSRVEFDRIEAVGGPGLPLPTRVRIDAIPSADADALDDALPGERLRLLARLRPPHALRNPGARDRVRVLERRGVGAVGRLVGPGLHVRVAEARGPLASVHRVRRTLAQRLDARGPGGGLLAALALGERRFLREETRAAFARLGLSHLLAVSGLHLLLVAGLLFAPLRLATATFGRVADDRRIALVGAVAGAALFAALTGFAVPVRRALIVLLAVAAGVARGRTGTRAEPLAAAAIVVLVLEPGALFEPGAQLSFAAGGALAMAGGDPAERSGSRLIDALRTSATAVAATAPLAALHFGQATPWALAANALAVPWTAFVLLPAALGSGLAALCPDPSLTTTLLGWGERVAAASLTAVEVAADWAPETGPGAPPGFPWLAAACGLSLAVLRSGSTLVRAAGVTASALLLSFAPVRAVEPAPPRVVVLDVGQGDATLVQGRTGTVLVDAGGAIPGGTDLGRRVVLPALAALGVRRLDLLVVTHADLDHRGGAASVLERLPIGAVWLPFGGSVDADFDALRGAALARGVAVLERGAGSPAIALGDLRVLPLWPPRESHGTRNDRSLVVRIDVGDRRVLFAGDLEARAEAQLTAGGRDLRADVLLLPHHGSRTSSSAELLRAVAADVAVASAARFGRFGMPHVEALERARGAGLPVWWTGRDGAVRIALDRPLFAIGTGAARD